MKKKFYKIISYLLIAGMTMTTFSSIAMAEEIVETTGEGTPETPAITKTTNTETDENSGETSPGAESVNTTQGDIAGDGTKLEICPVISRCQSAGTGSAAA